ncbi:MAG: ATP-binding protein [Actinomycetota bacterium]
MTPSSPIEPSIGRESLEGATIVPRGFAHARTIARTFRSSIRTRILTGFILILAASTIASILIVREVALSQLDARLDDELTQESRELIRLARDGIDPDTGEPFRDDVETLFDVFLARNVPARNEAFLAFVDGALHARSRTLLPYRLDRDPALVQRWAGLNQPERGEIDTAAGAVRYLAIPVREGGKTLGVFVAAVLRDIEAAEIEPAVWAAALVGLVAIVIGSLLAARITRRILGPVAAVQTDARSISETDLGRRIEVQGDDEIARLAATFNELLDRLEHAFIAQRAFVDDAGHELRTPITIVRGHLEVLEDDPAERRRTIALVTDELDRMARIVSDLLLLAKAEQPSFLAFALVDLGELTEDLFAKVSALGDRRWVLDATAAGSIDVDRHRLAQAVIQLAQNAVQHTTPADTIAVGSSISGNIARLWVRDSGPGVAPEVQERIFDRFTRGASRRSETGAGLGLAIVRAIVEGHGGRVRVDSRPGEGARFTIEVPVDRPQVEGAPSSSTPPQKEQR